MRFVKFVVVLITVFVTGVSYAQSQPEISMTAERESSPSIVQIFPNPAVEYVHVKVDDMPASKVKLAVHNILGNEMNIETEIVDEHELRVRVKDLASGYYLLAIKDEESKYRGTFKFLKR